MDAPEIVISPYVTTRGGVVILNGPFLPIDQAYRIAALCKAAPDLLKACRAIVENTVIGETKDFNYPRWAWEEARAAIAKAKPA